MLHENMQVGYHSTICNIVDSFSNCIHIQLAYEEPYLKPIDGPYII